MHEGISIHRIIRMQRLNCIHPGFSDNAVTSNDPSRRKSYRTA